VSEKTSLGERATTGPGDFVDHVLEVVRAIPSGHVMTYGDVAATLGSRGARAVGTVMARYGTEVPWWRVIRAGGLAPRGHEDRALAHYVAEGTPLRHSAGTYRVDVATARVRRAT
jgi:alkylated DNA nucleotide flippase Atl1